MTSTRRWSGLGVLLLVLATLVSCGLPEDGEPRPISGDLADQLNQTEGGQPAANPIEGNDWIVYVVETDPSGDATSTENQRLAQFRAGAAGVPTPDALVTLLLTTREASLADDQTLSNAIPPDTTLVDYRLNRDRDTAILTLSPEFANVQMPALKLAVAQLVYTATEVGGVGQVQFRVGDTFEDSDLIDVPAGENDESKTTVGREDYEDLKPELPS